MKAPQLKTKSEEFMRFEQTLRRLIAVPKREVDDEKEKYKQQREKEDKRKRPAK